MRDLGEHEEAVGGEEARALRAAVEKRRVRLHVLPVTRTVTRAVTRAVTRVVTRAVTRAVRAVTRAVTNKVARVVTRVVTTRAWTLDHVHIQM